MSVLFFPFLCVCASCPLLKPQHIHQRHQLLFHAFWWHSQHIWQWYVYMLRKIEVNIWMGVGKITHLLQIQVGRLCKVVVTCCSYKWQHTFCCIYVKLLYSARRYCLKMSIIFIYCTQSFPVLQLWRAFFSEVFGFFVQFSKIRKSGRGNSKI